MRTWAVVDSNGLVIDSILWDGDESTGFDINLVYPDRKVRLIEYTDENPAGIGYTYDGKKFSPPPPPEVDKQQLIFEAEGQRQMLIADANSVFLEWQTRLLLDIATPSQKAAVKDWLSYIEAVRKVDVSNAPDVKWPEKPPVPENAK